ncbi:MAG: response regulator transcription factor [Thermomicrobiales bacterium]|nr:response regulator transcription factor [Thermomicrobiales bacterium]
MTVANHVVRVAVISGYPAVHAGISVLLRSNPGIDVIQLDGNEALGAIELDAIVVDHESLETAVDLAHALPQQPPFVVLGAEPESDWPDLGTGPVAFLRNGADASELVAAVLGVANGLIVIDPEIAGLAGLRWNGVIAPLDPAGEILTPREMEVLNLVANGLPNKTIAHQLDISEHTVKFHVGSILTKLDAASRTEAVTIATRRGLLAV